MNREQQERINQEVEDATMFLSLLNLKEPAALIIPTKRRSLERNYFSPEYNEEQLIVNALRKAGIDAVPHCSKEAQSPSKTVVMPGSIQTPILKPQEMERAAKIITQSLLEAKASGVKLYAEIGKAIPVQTNQMVSPSQNKTNFDWVSGSGNNLDIQASCQEKEEYKRLRVEYGDNFEFDLLQEALNSEDLISQWDLEKVNYEKIHKLYRGATQGNNPYAILAGQGSMSFAYATPTFGTAASYTGVKEFGGTNSPFSAYARKGNESINLGFIYEYDVSENTHLWHDYSLESGANPQYVASEIKGFTSSGTLETPVFKEKHKCTAIYVHIKKDGKSGFYKVPDNDKKWKALLSLYNSSDITLSEHMAERRNKQLANPKTHSLMPKTLGLFKKKIKAKDFIEDYRDICPETYKRKKEGEKQKISEKQLDKIRGIGQHNIQKPVQQTTMTQEMKKTHLNAYTNG